MKYAQLFGWLTSLYSKVPSCLPGGYALPPMLIYLRLTDDCNLTCRHCYIFQCDDEERASRSGADLSFAEIRQLVEQVSRKAVISVTGAEVFTRTDIMEILRLISDRNPCRVITNGTLISESDCQSLIDMGSKNAFGKGLISVAVSLHGSDATVHDGITGFPGSYDETVNTIKRLVEIRRSREQKSPSIDLTIVILSENVETLNDIFELAEEMGVDSCNFMLLRQIIARKHQADSDGSDMLYEAPPEVERIDRSILESQLYSLVRRGEGSSIRLRFTPAKMPIPEILDYYTDTIDLDEYICGDYPWYRLFIESNGDLGLCHYHTHSSIRKDRIRDVWNSKPYVDFRKTLKKKRTFPACYGCSNLCYVGKDGD